MGAGGSIAFRTYLCPLKRKRANPDPEISEDRSPRRPRANCRTGNWGVRCGYGARSAGAVHQTTILGPARARCRRRVPSGGGGTILLTRARCSRTPNRAFEHFRSTERNQGLHARWERSLKAGQPRVGGAPGIGPGTEGQFLADRRGLMRSEAQVALGIEAGSDGRAIGRDPRKMGPGELRALGHMPMAPAAAIRAHWAVRATEVRKCTAVRCPSWPFRLGANPWRAPLSEAERARRRERKARVGKRAGNRRGLLVDQIELNARRLPPERLREEG
jgi:hypothetical protein